jgi:hypothetical protein
MKQPKSHKAVIRDRVPPPVGVDLTELAAQATYIPYAVHKIHHVPGTAPSRRSDATPCPIEVTLAEAQTWLRDAITVGDVGGSWDGKPYPRYVWTRIEERVFEARLSNQELGQYHGYPIDRQEWPKWMS